MKLKYNSKNQGLTLVEALIWFALLAAVIAGIFGVYQSNRNSNNSTTVNKELSTIFTQTESLFSTETTDGLTNVNAVQLGVFPKTVKIVGTGTTINNIFGGTIDLTGIAPSGFQIVYTNVPAGSVCSNIIRSQKAVGWDSVDVSGKPIVYTTQATSTLSLIGEACGVDGTPPKILTLVRANKVG